MNDFRPKWLKQAHGKNCDCTSCFHYKPDLHRPKYVFGTDLEGYNYRCPDCNEGFMSFKSANRHMGRVPNDMGSCPGPQ